MAASVKDHRHYVPAFDLLKSVKEGTVHEGLIGGMVFDMLHLYAAHKANCDRIYTFNVKDFRACFA